TDGMSLGRTARCRRRSSCFPRLLRVLWRVEVRPQLAQRHAGGAGDRDRTLVRHPPAVDPLLDRLGRHANPASEIALAAGVSHRALNRSLVTMSVFHGPTPLQLQANLGIDDPECQVKLEVTPARSPCMLGDMSTLGGRIAQALQKKNGGNQSE